MLAWAPAMHACSPPCVDDGLHGRQNCAASSTSTATTSTTDTSTTSTTGTTAVDSTGATGTNSTGDPGTTAITSSGTTAVDSTGTTGGSACADLVKNNDESDVDCGGSCQPCPDNKMCNDASDCETEACHYLGFCVPPTCANGILDFDEIGLDCGGMICGKTCGLGAFCGSDDECYMGGCVFPAGKCALDPLCGNNNQDPLETWIDCGGVCGPTCRFGEPCKMDGDCTAQSCTNDVCDNPAQCSDKLKNGAETDVDCAGPCVLCQLGQACVFTSDCGPNLTCNGDVCSP